MKSGQITIYSVIYTDTIPLKDLSKNNECIGFTTTGYFILVSYFLLLFALLSFDHLRDFLELE